MMTYAEAKERFIGMTLVEVEPEYRCRADRGSDECTFCCNADSGDPECGDCISFLMQLKVDKVHTTRRSFLLECDAFNVSVVVPKAQAHEFKLRSATLSPELTEQVENIGLELNEAQFLFCRTWRNQTRRYGMKERTYVYPCAREQANCLILTTRRDSRGEFLSSEMELYGGICRRLHSWAEYADNDEGREGDMALDFWGFSYDPESDRLQIPADEADEKTDEMTQP